MGASLQLGKEPGLFVDAKCVRSMSVYIERARAKKEPGRRRSKRRKEEAGGGVVYLPCLT